MGEVGYWTFCCIFFFFFLDCSMDCWIVGLDWIGGCEFSLRACVRAYETGVKEGRGVFLMR